jgi:GNAT superfamily N-acetyltransferase
MTRIEQASQADVEALATLNLRVHQLHVRHAPRFFIQPTEAQVREGFRELLVQENVRAFIAYAEGIPVGYVLVLIHERPADAIGPARRWLYIDQISVEPQWERQGIGRQLMQSVMDLGRAAGIDELETDIWAFNENAQAFFESFGFLPKIQRFWMQLESG